MGSPSEPAEASFVPLLPRLQSPNLSSDAFPETYIFARISLNTKAAVNAALFAYFATNQPC